MCSAERYSGGGGGGGGFIGGLKGSKGANVRGGELNGILLQVEFRFRNRLGRPYTCFAKFPLNSLDKCRNS